MNENLPEIPAYDIYWKKKLKSLKDISYSRDGNYLLAGSGDGRAYLFNKDGTELWRQDFSNITCLDVSGDASRIIVGNYSGSLALLSKEGKHVLEKKVNGSINSLSISDDGKNICAGTDKGIIIDFNEAGNELWKHKIKGALDGGICHSPDGKYIAAGSWDTVHLFSVDGKIIWKFKFNKKIAAVSVAENGSLIVACTKGSIGFVGNEGHTISEKAVANGFLSASICENCIYAISSNKIYIFNNKGEQLTSFEAPEDLLKICANSKEFISVISENRVYMFSSLMKPQVNILTDSLTIGEKQPLKVELVNNSPKEFEFELELRSKELLSDNFKSTVKVPAKGKSNAEFKVIPNKIGKCNVEFFIKNKNIISDRNTIEIVPPKVELNISHHPKYEFNAEDDEITIVLDIENTGKVSARKIRVTGHDNLFLQELKPRTKESLPYKIKLPSGNHNLLKNIVYEDEFGNKFNVDCSCSVSVEKAPYVWGLKQPVPKIITGKPEIVKFNLKNIKKDVLDLIFNLTSKKIDIKPNNIPIRLSPSESKDISFTFTPKESGENIKLEVAIEYEGKKQKYDGEIKVYPAPPHITVKNYMPKNKYRLGEEIYETLELINDGESPAVNIQIEGMPDIIPILEPKKPKLVNRLCQNNEVKYCKSEKLAIKYGDDLGEYSTDFNSSVYTVLSPGIKIKVPEINLQENIKKEIKFEIMNVSNEVMKDITVEFLVDDDKVALDKREAVIETISPNTAKPVVFQCLAHTEGAVDFNICAQHQGTIIEQQFGTIMVGSKTPQLKFEADDREMLQNDYSLLKLKITNIGETEARDINIKLHSGIDKKLSKEAMSSDYPQLKEIKPYESKEITFGFHPITAGKVSLTIISSCKSVHGKNLEKKDEVFVTIRSQISKPDAIVNIGKIVDTEITDSIIQRSNLSSGKDIGSKGFKDSIVQRSSIGNNQENLKTYRALCIQAHEDGEITKEEREILNNQARQLGITELEKKQIEDEIFSNQNVQANLEAYRQQAAAVFRKGKITQDERALLDVLRIKFDMKKEQQKQIEDEILAKLSENKIIVDEEKFCPKCGKKMQTGSMFCAECGRKFA